MQHHGSNYCRGHGARRILLHTPQPSLPSQPHPPRNLSSQECQCLPNDPTRYAMDTFTSMMLSDTLFCGDRDEPESWSVRPYPRAQLTRQTRRLQGYILHWCTVQIFAPSASQRFTNEVPAATRVQKLSVKAKGKMSFGGPPKIDRCHVPPPSEMLGYTRWPNPTSQRLL
jgi:hypothetical protein